MIVCVLIVFCVVGRCCKLIDDVCNQVFVCLWVMFLRLLIMDLVNVSLVVNVLISKGFGKQFMSFEIFF